MLRELRSSYKYLATTILILFCCALIAYPLAAAEGKNVKKLTLQEALELALKNNLDIKLSVYTVQQSEGRYIQSKALNDIYLSVENSWSASTSVSTSVFGGGVDEVELVPGVGATTTESDFWQMTSSLRETIPTGGTWTASMNITSRDTNNAFASVNPERNANITLSFEQPLLKGFGFSFDVPQKDIIISRNNLEAGLEDFKLSLMQNLYSIISAYWDLVAAQKNLEVAEQSLELANDQLRRNKTQVEVGTMAPIEIVSAERGVAEAEVGIISARADVRNAQETLIKMLYASEENDIWNMRIVATDEPAPEELKVNLESQMETAINNRPELKKRLIELESADLNVKSSFWDMLPEVNVTGSVTSKGTGGEVLIFNTDNPFDPTREVIGSSPVEYSDIFQQITDRQFIDWSVGINVSFQLFNSNARGQHATQKAAETMAKVNLLKAKQDTIAAVRKAVRDLETSYLQIKANEKARILAERQLEAERKKFDVGSSTNFQVLQYVRDLEDARSQEVRARINYNLAIYNLQLETGVLLKENNIFIDPLEE